MEKTLKSIAINYGLYLGGLMALLTVIAYAVNLGLLTNMWYSLFILFAIIVFGIISIIKSRKELGGFISFKQSFTAYFLTVIVGLLVSTVVTYLLFNFIDTAAGEELKQKTVEATIAMLEGFNSPPEAIAEAVDKIESQNQYSIGNILKGLAGYIVFFSIIGLIVAAVMKRTDPNAQ